MSVGINYENDVCAQHGHRPGHWKPWLPDLQIRHCAVCNKVIETATLPPPTPVTLGEKLTTSLEEALVFEKSKKRKVKKLI